MNSVEHHYQMFGLEPGASGAEIKQAYRDLVIVWHPDRFPGNSRLQKIATEKLKEFNLAYQELMEFVENSWYENLFGFEEEEFTTGEAEHAEDVQAHPENSDQGPEGPEKEESRMENKNGSDAQPHSENAEAHDWFEEGGEFTHKTDDAEDTRIHSEEAETQDWLDKGYDSLKNGRLEEAVLSFEKSLEINPRLKETWIAKGLTLEKLNKLEEGLECFQRALEIDPNSEDAWIAKGNILYGLFKNREALDCYDRALAINPKNAEVSYRRWVALQQSSYRQPFLLDAGKERSTQMPNDLIGDLSKASLFNIIQSLVDRRKSGMVAIEGKNAAELYIEGGNIVHGKTDGLIGEEAILAIMDLNEGRVLFNWQLSPDRQTVRTSTEQLMSIWSQRDEEWKKVRKVMPTSNAIFSIVLDSGGEDRTIPAKQWSVFALCNGERTVFEIAGLVGQPVFEISKTISKMVEMGVLVETRAAGNSQAPHPGTVDEIFFAAVETELKKVVGPIARVIIDDTLVAFEEPREAFPKEKVMSFIKTVSDQIIEDRKRGQFEEACNTLESVHSDF